MTYKWSKHWKYDRKMTLKTQKMIYNLKTTQNGQKMHYKITIFGVCAPYPRLIYCIASSISQERKMTCHQNPEIERKL